MSSFTVKEIGHGISHLFYPRLCEGCGKPLLKEEAVVCISCGLQIPETNYHNIEDNETALRFAGRVPFVYATSLAYFTNDGLLQHLVHGLKYQGKKETGYYLGRRLAQSMQKIALAVNWAPAIDLIIPVPLHKTKQAKRGYNQSMMIAGGMTSILNIPASDKLLLRIKDTESQTRKTRTERVNNMTDAFKVIGGSGLSNKHILLCDDVLTTGATLEACALALLKEENVKISIATIGIAVS